jgi:periplasmic nitrate reductase NapE
VPMMRCTGGGVAPTVSMRAAMQADTAPVSRSSEFLVFISLAVLIWPVIAVAFVGTYGFVFWIYFLLNGPPGPS